jgi:beta-glucosidase
MTRPVLELKGFDKRDLMPGQTQTIHLVVPRSEWGYFNGDRHWVMEPGEFEVSVGFSSDQRPLQTTLVLD